MSPSAVRPAKQYKEIVERIHAEAFNEGEYDVLNEMLPGDFVQHGQGLGETFHGADEVGAMIEMYRSAFSDLTFNERGDHRRRHPRRPLYR